MFQLIGILISLAAATASSNDDNSKKAASGGAEKKSDKAVAVKAAESSTSTSTTNSRTAKSLKSSKPGDNRGKRTLYDFGNAGYLYPQIAARRGGYSPDARAAYNTQPGYFNGNGIGRLCDIVTKTS